MISVIIPTLNEAELLPITLSRLRANTESHEILVVDGGSTDATMKLAEAAGARVVTSPRRQRAIQMNLGAQQARGDTLLFLHADTWVETSACEQIEKALRNPAVVGGAFARRFRSESPVLRAACWLSECRCRAFGWFYGDQGIFTRREAFEKIGGFYELPVFEDVDFCRRLSRRGKLVTLRPPVVSSARRFTVRGPFNTLLSDAWLTLRYFCGADPHRLAEKSSGKKLPQLLEKKQPGEFRS